MLNRRGYRAGLSVVAAMIRMQLGVDGWRLHGQRTGVGRYILSLLQHFAAGGSADSFPRINVYVPAELELAELEIPASVAMTVLKSRLPMVAWDNLRLGPTARESVVLYPSFSKPLITRGASVVVTHDATMRVVPEMFSRRDRLIYDPLYGWSARSATLVITTSEAAKQDIVNAWGVDPDKIRVTHMAASSKFHPLPVSVDRSSLRRSLTGGDAPYFMFVGKISGRRNIPQLLRAHREFSRQGHPQKMLVVGPDYAIAETRRIAAELGVDDLLLTRSFVPDDELNGLYNCADAFVMPSAYENGSLPVFEAQAAGTAVISVDTPGTREITGGEALLIPKLEVREMVQAMTKVATDSHFRASLAQRGLTNSHRFSWAKCASETLAVCSEAVDITRRH